jgi:SpoVK/Ycf46/Vps4 family AAA+-type ATPase
LDSLAPSRSSSSSSTTDQNNTSNFALTLQSLIPSLSSSSRSQKNKNNNTSQKVLILATATDADSVDSSLRSPKIFGKEVELPVPSKSQREQILNKMLLKINHNLKTEDVKGAVSH